MSGAAEDVTSRYRGMRGDKLTAPTPISGDAIRRFVHAIMDTDPTYFDVAVAGASKFGGIAAPPLYPVHAFRRPGGSPDPLQSVQDDPDADGTAGTDAIGFGLPPIESPFKRLLNGGNDIEFFRCLHDGETAVAQARYAEVTVKQGRSGAFLLVVIETEFSTTGGEKLLLNRQSLIWR
jgi:N-terminal half of MaoC dehydratase